MERIFVSLKEAAKALCIAEKTARNWLTQGKFPVRTYKIGGKLLVKVSELLEFVSRLSSPAVAIQVAAVNQPGTTIKRGRGRPRNV
jgi:hypothetical protein